MNVKLQLHMHCKYKQSMNLICNQCTSKYNEHLLTYLLNGSTAQQHTFYHCDKFLYNLCSVLIHKIFLLHHYIQKQNSEDVYYNLYNLQISQNSNLASHNENS